MNKLKHHAKSKIGYLIFSIFVLISLCLYFFLKTPAGNSATENKFQFTDARKPFPVERARSGLIAQPAGNVYISLSDQVDRLIATRDPNDALDAYRLVQDCIDFEKWGNIPFFGFPHPREMTGEEKNGEMRLCSGLTERMKTSRLDHLAYAAKNGAQGADVTFFVEGPFGDRSALDSRPDDPLVMEWKKQAIAQLTENAGNGNHASLTVLANEYETSSGVAENNPSLALTYAFAARKIDDHIGIPSPYSDESLAQLQGKLSANEIKEAATAATSIYANWLKNAQK
jgi:hypothetical protein